MSALTDTRDHARKMAGDPNVSTKDAALWFQIANEIDNYLHRDEVVDLFGDTALEPEETTA